MYKLLIRIGKEFNEVNYVEGCLANDEFKATLFNTVQKEIAQLELSTVLEETDYKFVRSLSVIDYIV